MFKFPTTVQHPPVKITPITNRTLIDKRDQKYCCRTTSNIDSNSNQMNQRENNLKRNYIKISQRLHKILDI